MSVYLLEPLDTQFHRSTLPFDAGEDIEALSRQIPWPRTVYGALRAAGFVNADIGLSASGPDQFHEIWGDADSPGNLIIKGPFVYRGQGAQYRILLPAPADLLYQKIQDDRCYLRHCVPDENKQMKDFSDCTQGFGYLRSLGVLEAKPRVKLEKMDAYFLSSGDDLAKYLCQRLGNRTFRERGHPSFPLNEEIFVTENRVGITRSHALHTAEEGRLYSAPHSRCVTLTGRRTVAGQEEQKIGFWVELESPDSAAPLPHQGVLRLGGESRPAQYRLLGVDQPGAVAHWARACRDVVIQTIAQQGRFKLYLITPGLFSGRAHPFDENQNGIGFTFLAGGRSVTAQLVGMALTDKVLIGGWNIVKGHASGHPEGYPKALETGTAPGTVYFFEIPDWPEDSEEQQSRASEVFDALNFTSLCGIGGSPATAQREGFGIVLTGGWHVQ